jgi:hypothetical protein
MDSDNIFAVGLHAFPTRRLSYNPAPKHPDNSEIFQGGNLSGTLLFPIQR